jgi:hypothetical protein
VERLAGSRPSIRSEDKKLSVKEFLSHNYDSTCLLAFPGHKRVSRYDGGCGDWPFMRVGHELMLGRAGYYSKNSTDEKEISAVGYF